MHCKVVSLTKKVWAIHSGHLPLNSVDEIVPAILKNRGIEKQDDFKKASLTPSMLDPSDFLDMEKAICRIIKALKNGEKISIFGDYDVDGVCSTSIFVNFLDHLGANYSYFVPSRLKEGYGLNLEAIKKCRDSSLLITVDCGCTAIEELSYAKECGIDVIVLDHHKMSTIPPAVAVINPHRPDEKDKYKTLCATGLAFICMVGVNRQLESSGFYGERKIAKPNADDYLDLVALATVCDVVELVGLNRLLVANGIKSIKKRKNLGIDALMSLNKGHGINSDTIAFFLGPRLNAPGRIASADISVKLLTTKNPIEAKKLALRLDELNKERQLLEARITAEAEESIDDNLKFICVYSQEWHAGVIGIVAGRLKEKYNKPSFVIALDPNGNGRASCRSIGNFDLSPLIGSAMARGIVFSGGGHSLAAGFSVNAGHLDDLIDFLKSEVQYDATTRELYADCFMSLGAISSSMVKSIAALGPFGMGHRHPKFVIQNLTISQTRVVGQNHIQTVLQDEKNNVLRGIAFKALGTELGDVLMNHSAPVNVLGGLSISEWRGEEYVNLYLEDVAECA
ncbi:MAG: single-stranded-DNA-specific exonuclease RecJ [Holosporaceae bacterium]|jgi:single-stranded-DNA-specific exonuclease|nr:single-stranded-DNA-specific exonuclease RecJ [Holosporaceae bacterium]